MSMLATMLQQKVTPLAEYQPSKKANAAWERAFAESVKTAPKAVKKNKERRLTIALKKYKAVWREGEVWLRTCEIESRIGYVRGACLKTLTRWVIDGHMVKRPYGGEPFTTLRGYEWRWV